MSLGVTFARAVHDDEERESDQNENDSEHARTVAGESDNLMSAELG
jgi:hypothetical protein